MQRIIIVGTTGSGKTVLGERLAQHLGYPFLELDALFWAEGWQKVPTEVFRERVRAAIAERQWVAGGNYSVARDLLWGCADTLIWLDYPLPLTLWRLFRRTLKRILTQETLWAGNRETWRAQFFSRNSLFLWALQSQPRQRQQYPQTLALPEYAHLRIHRFLHPRQTEHWLGRFVRTIPIDKTSASE